MNDVLEKIVRQLKQKNLRYEIHKFNSGCVMVDIWKDKLFYVIQIESEMIGLSMVDENNGFNRIPDKIYKDWNTFRTDFENMFS